MKTATRVANAFDPEFEEFRHFGTTEASEKGERVFRNRITGRHGVSETRRGTTLSASKTLTPARRSFP